MIFYPKKKRRNAKGTQLAELAAALLILFLVLFTLIDLLICLAAVTTIAFNANESARLAGSAATWTQAKAYITARGDTKTSPYKTFWNFAQIQQPTSGAGLTLTVLKVPADGNGTPTLVNAPNDPIDTTGKYFYEYAVEANYNVKAVLNFSNWPGLGQTPLLGKPVPIKFTSTSYCEHPDGLNQ